MSLSLIERLLRAQNVAQALKKGKVERSLSNDLGHLNGVSGLPKAEQAVLTVNDHGHSISL